MAPVATIRPAAVHPPTGRCGEGREGLKNAVVPSDDQQR